MEEPGGLLSIRPHRVGHDWSDLACMHALEKEMATHPNILAWRIPDTEAPGGLPSMGSHRVWGPLPLRQTQRSPEGPRHLHRYLVKIIKVVLHFGRELLLQYFSWYRQRCYFPLTVSVPSVSFSKWQCCGYLILLRKAVHWRKSGFSRFHIQTLVINVCLARRLCFLP